MSSAVAFAGLTAARARLQRLAEGLKRAADGEVVRRAGEAVAGVVRSVATKRLAAHEMSGHAAALTKVDVDGGRIDLHGMPPANGKGWSGRSYVGMKPWWPFRGDKMPPFILKQAAVIFARELLAVVAGEDSDAAREALAVVREADTAAAAADLRALASATRKSARKAERELARIQKAREKAERRASDRAAAKFKRDTARIARQWARGSKRKGASP